MNLMSSATRLVLALVAGCVAAIVLQAALSLLCSDVPFCQNHGPIMVGVAFLASALLLYQAMLRTSSSEPQKDLRKVMAADTAAGDGEIGGGDSGGDD